MTFLSGRDKNLKAETMRAPVKILRWHLSMPDVLMRGEICRQQTLTFNLSGRFERSGEKQWNGRLRKLFWAEARLRDWEKWRLRLFQANPWNLPIFSNRSRDQGTLTSIAETSFLHSFTNTQNRERLNHAALNMPVPIWTLKSNNIKPWQYFGGRPLGIFIPSHLPNGDEPLWSSLV